MYDDKGLFKLLSKLRSAEPMGLKDTKLNGVQNGAQTGSEEFEDTELKDTALNDLQTDYVKTCGKIVAPLYSKFAHFVKDRAEHPIHVSYRSAHPAKHALDHLGMESKELWVNRKVSKNLNKQIVQDYFIQQGLDKPFTFVDNGYGGTISDELHKSGLVSSDMRTILLTHGAHTDMKNNYLAMLSGDKNSNHSILSPLMFMYLIESLPHKFKNFGFDVFDYNKKGDVTVEPRKKSRFARNVFKTFYDGMTAGYALCDNNQKNFMKYLDILSDAQKVFIDFEYFDKDAEDVYALQDYHEKMTKHNSDIEKILS